ASAGEFPLASEGAAAAIRRDRSLLHGTSARAVARLLRPVKVRRFDPTDDLIIIKARLYGPRGHRPLSLAFDTAASETHIVPEIIDDLGYSPRQAICRKES